MSTTSAQNDPLTPLEGTWYVNMSNFKMWLKGDKVNPRFQYTVQTQDGIRGLQDIVRYDKNNKPKTIQGFDKPLDATAKQFVWRGKGLLFLFKSKWEILYQTDDWTLIHFEKTLATAEGYDIISRQKSLAAFTIDAIRVKLRELGIGEELTVIAQQ